MKKIAPLLLVLAVLPAWIDPFRDRVSEGNKSYHEKKFDLAVDSYKKAEPYAPDAASRLKLGFNRGTAEYGRGDDDRALLNLQGALSSEDKDVQKKAFFNMGNTYMRQGNYKEAVNSFINALRIDPKYDKAKKNIEYILKNHPENQGQQQDKDKQGKNGPGRQNQNDPGQQGQKNRQSAADPSRGTGKQMSREQVQAVLDAMKNKPVRRQGGASHGKRQLEKNW